MSDLTVRRFEPADRERVRILADAAMAETPEYVPGAPDHDLRDVAGHYLDAGGEFLVGVRDGDVVATGAYEPLTDWKTDHLEGPFDETAELTRMRVDPDQQGLGHGSAVYAALERRARRDGYDRFVLDTGVENDRARGFYEGHGFEHVRTVAVTFDDVTLDLAIYRKRLS